MFRVGGQDVTRLSPKDKLRTAGVAYILQDKSVFPGMTVEENLWMGGYLMASPAQARASRNDPTMKIRRRPRPMRRTRPKTWSPKTSSRPRVYPIKIIDLIQFA